MFLFTEFIIFMSTFLILFSVRWLKPNKCKIQCKPSYTLVSIDNLFYYFYLLANIIVFIMITDSKITSSCNLDISFSYFCLFSRNSLRLFLNRYLLRGIDYYLFFFYLPFIVFYLFKIFYNNWWSLIIV